MAMNSPENAPRAPSGSMFAMKHAVANLQMFSRCGCRARLPLECAARQPRRLTGGTAQTQKKVIAGHVFPNSGSGLLNPLT